MTPVPEPQLTGRFRITRGWILRILGSAALLAVTFMLLPTGQVMESLGRLDWLLFASILLLFMGSHVAAAAKWRFLLGRGVLLRSAVRAHFAGLAANLCLPGVAGGDVVRGALVMRELGDTARLISVSLTDRLVDMVALALLAFIGLLLLGEDLLTAVDLGHVSASAVILVLGLIATCGLGSAFLILPLIARWLSTWSRKRPGKGVLQSAALAISDLAARRSALAVALAASFLIQGAIVALAIMLATGIGVEAPVAVWLFAWPLAKILAVAPISLGGIGVREASLAGLMAPFGADPAGVVAASLIWQGVLFAAGAIGAMAWALTMRSAARIVRQAAVR